jgi:LasA protease
MGLVVRLLTGRQLATKHSMKHPLYKLLASILLLSVASACASSGYFVPPAATHTTPPQAVALLADTAVPELIDPPATTEADPVATLAGEPTSTPQTTFPAFPQPVTSQPTTQVNTAPILYYAQAADTLRTVAIRFGVKPDEITSPDPIPPSDFIPPNQLLIIPRRLANTTSSEHLIPDSDVVFSPSAADFDVEAYVKQAGGRLSTYHEWLKSTGDMTGAQVVMRVAIENSINPRILLSLLEYQSHWVTGQPTNLAEDQYPMGLIDLSQEGLFHQLVWAVNQLSIGYYAYREGRLTEIHFADGSTARLAPDLNAGTVALQYFFAQLYDGQRWLDALDPNKGFPAVHARLFGDPWQRALTVEPLFPTGLTQPQMTLPFVRNWIWSFTGGPHGAWEHDGAYAALDFAPGSVETGCVPSDAWVLASASGMVTRSGNGVVALDLDGDGREQTGWVLIYLHISSDQRVPIGSWVDAGDKLGHPSCEGGIATGTHVHMARKYNGEWIPADGPIPFNLGGWIAHAGDAAYKGSLTRDGVTINACTCGSFATRIIRTDQDP